METDNTQALTLALPPPLCLPTTLRKLKGLSHQHATLCNERDLTWLLEPSGVAGPILLRSPEPHGIVRSLS